MLDGTDRAIVLPSALPRDASGASETRTPSGKGELGIYLDQITDWGGGCRPRVVCARPPSFFFQPWSDTASGAPPSLPPINTTRKPTPPFEPEIALGPTVITAYIAVRRRRRRRTRPPPHRHPPPPPDPTMANTPILVWMLYLNREVQPEEYQACYDLIHGTVPHCANVPHQPTSGESMRMLVANMMPLLMMRHRRIPRARWRDHVTSNGKHWIEQVRCWPSSGGVRGSVLALCAGGERMGSAARGPRCA
ncbi:hypothetical protein OF83DRAFT_1150540, partial [Amylostereum chailletii]